ncbi:uncharacterized protein MYCGRDRAFT_96752 [Zymoseptoria tritici IPO323]|uniref:Uncharacterized protein n=1 Tax=Zymoseptoria tritici (strain CBS 115943 / IPO323) TaxID=336722 RepID=F9XM02_ZYMTI|nr:uncharacterized protein MYCGRDRAFT_96752 [Zymoseptoria tritici IPO323]EGP83398.1 hypothetical protein MYCGRDRAFT_96752 [Zymoseptoria tritici IPO323]
MQQVRYNPDHSGHVPRRAVSPHSQEHNFKIYREYLVRRIKDVTQGSEPTSFFTDSQLPLLQGDAAEWDKTLLEHILDLAIEVAEIARTDFNSNMSEADNIQHYVRFARSWMYEYEQMRRLWRSEADVQNAVKECRAAVRTWWRNRATEVANEERKQRKESIQQERKEAMESLVALIRTSISRSPADVMDVWEGIEEQIDQCQGTLTEEVKESIAKEFARMWKHVQAPRRTGWIFHSTKPRPKGCQAKVAVTWKIPPGGEYDSEKGHITYETSHAYTEFYRHDTYPWSPDLKDPPETITPFLIDPIKVRFSTTTLNGKPTKGEVALKPREIEAQDVRRALALRSGARSEANAEVSQTSSTSSTWSEEL